MQEISEALEQEKAFKNALEKGMYFRQFAYFRQLLLKNAQEGWKIQFELQGTLMRPL